MTVTSCVTFLKSFSNHRRLATGRSSSDSSSCLSAPFGCHPISIFRMRFCVRVGANTFAPMSATKSFPGSYFNSQDPASSFHRRCAALTFRRRVLHAPVAELPKAMAAVLSHFRTFCVFPAISSTKQLTLSPRMTDSMTSINSASAVESAGKGCLEDFQAIGSPQPRENALHQAKMKHHWLTPTQNHTSCGTKCQHLGNGSGSAYLDVMLPRPKPELSMWMSKSDSRHRRCLALSSLTAIVVPQLLVVLRELHAESFLVHLPVQL